MIDSIDKLKDTLEESLLQPSENANMERSERVLSLVTGAFMFCKGIGNMYSHPLLAFGEAVIGTVLLNRGVSGHCFIKAMSEEPAEVKETIIFSEMGQQNTEPPQSMPNGAMNQPPGSY
jgi:hypothetical protein